MADSITKICNIWISKHHCTRHLCNNTASLNNTTTAAHRWSKFTKYHKEKLYMVEMWQQ